MYITFFNLPVFCDRELLVQVPRGRQKTSENFFGDFYRLNVLSDTYKSTEGKKEITSY